MPTAADNFRVEVWDRDGTARLELISQSPDLSVSLAAWHAAVRCRPGVLLIHYNAGHVMDRMVTPGVAGPPSDPPRAVTFADLAQWHELHAFCNACLRRGALDKRKLMRRFGETASLAAAEGKLLCTRCRSTGAVRLEVTAVPR